MQEIIIRKLDPTESKELEELLYQAVFQAQGEEPYERDIIYIPEIYQYIKDFGKEHDYCLVAELEGKIIGGVWTRLLIGDIRGYGNIDDTTPEFAISLLPEFRNKGIGTRLMKEMIQLLKTKGYRQTSLSVQKINYAVSLYQKVGFEIIGEKEDDYIMLLKLE